MGQVSGPAPKCSRPGEKEGKAALIGGGGNTGEFKRPCTGSGPKTWEREANRASNFRSCAESLPKTDGSDGERGHPTPHRLRQGTPRFPGVLASLNAGTGNGSVLNGRTFAS